MKINGYEICFTQSRLFWLSPGCWDWYHRTQSTASSTYRWSLPSSWSRCGSSVAESYFRHEQKPLSCAACGRNRLDYMGRRRLGSFTSDVSRFFTGSPTKKAIWLLVAGIMAIIVGLLGTFRGRKWDWSRTWWCRYYLACSRGETEWVYGLGTIAHHYVSFVASQTEKRYFSVYGWLQESYVFLNDF